MPNTLDVHLYGRQVATTIGEFGPHPLRTLERAAGLVSGHLDDVALRIATTLQSAVTEVIDALPGSIREIPAVQLSPYATYAQTLRVRDLLAP